MRYSLRPHRSMISPGTSVLRHETRRESLLRASDVRPTTPEPEPATLARRSPLRPFGFDFSKVSTLPPHTEIPPDVPPTPVQRERHVRIGPRQPVSPGEMLSMERPSAPLKLEERIRQAQAADVSAQRLVSDTDAWPPTDILPVQREAGYVPGTANSPYSNLAEDTAALGPHKDFTPKVKNGVIETNSIAALMGNQLQQATRALGLDYASDYSGSPLALKRVVMDLAEIDHIYPYEGGGVNSVLNAQVLSSNENNAKGATYPWAPQGGRYSGARIMVTDPVSVPVHGSPVPAFFAKGEVYPVSGAGGAATVNLSSKIPGAAAVPVPTARAYGLAPKDDPK